MSRKSLITIAAVTAALFAATFLPLRQLSAANNRWGADYFPNVTLTTQDGKAVHFYDDLLKGKIVVIDLIYTNCQYSCPLETARMAQVQRILGDRVGKDIFFYSISIDPVRDTPEQLKAYAEKFHAGPGWLFLTGKKDDIDLISKKLGLYSDPDVNKDGHTPDVLLGNEATGQWIRNSALDNPRYLSVMIGDWLNSWHNAKLGTSYTAATPFSIPDQGKYLFKTHCAACHTVGQGDSVGPDLMSVTKVRDHDWLTSFISTPDKVLAANDPIAKALYAKYKQVNMPNLRLSSEDVKLLIHYLETENAAFEDKAAAEKLAAEAQAKLNSEAKMDPNMKMDHSNMDHSPMDHSKMNHAMPIDPNMKMDGVSTSK